MPGRCLPLEPLSLIARFSFRAGRGFAHWPLAGPGSAPLPKKMGLDMTAPGRFMLPPVLPRKAELFRLGVWAAAWALVAAA